MFGLHSATKTRFDDWKSRNGINILRFSLGFIFLWFGALKFFHGVSPAEHIAGKTISRLTFSLIKPYVSLPILGLWECTIGLGLITGAWLRLTLILLYFQMAGTFLPLLFFPEQSFSGSILVPTLLGQYIIKNCVLISAGIVLGANQQSKSKAENFRIASEPKIPTSIPEPQTFDESFLTHRN